MHISCDNGTRSLILREKAWHGNHFISATELQIKINLSIDPINVRYRISMLEH
jgi:hypothetical protein